MSDYYQQGPVREYRQPCHVCGPNGCYGHRKLAKARDLTPGEETSLEKIAALRGELGRMRASLKWALAEVQDRSRCDEDGMPNHACEFFNNPEKGACDFHEQWFDAVELAEGKP